MANYGIGLGAFMDGLIGGMKARESIETAKEEREWRAKGRARQEKSWSEEDQLKATYKDAAGAAQTARTAEVEQQMTSGYSPEAGGWNIGGKLYKTEAEARQAVDGQVGSFLDHYMKVGAPKVMESYLVSGQPEKAKAFQTWMTNEKTQAGAKNWAGAVRSAMLGDLPSFKENANAALANPEYGGGMAKIGDARQTKDEKGNVTGIEVDFLDRDGKKTTQTFKGSEDLFRSMMLFASPDAVFKYASGQLESRDKAVAEAMKQQRDAVLTEQQKVRDHQRTLQRDERQFQDNLTRDQINHQQALALEAVKSGVKGDAATIRKQIEEVRRELAKTDATMEFSRLPAEEQNKRALAVLMDQYKRAGDSGISVKGGTAQPAPTARGVIVDPNPGARR